MGVDSITVSSSSPLSTLPESAEFCEDRDYCSDSAEDHFLMAAAGGAGSIDPERCFAACSWAIVTTFAFLGLVETITDAVDDPLTLAINIPFNFLDVGFISYTRYLLKGNWQNLITFNPFSAWKNTWDNCGQPGKGLWNKVKEKAAPAPVPQLQTVPVQNYRSPSSLLAETYLWMLHNSATTGIGGQVTRENAPYLSAAIAGASGLSLGAGSAFSRLLFSF